MKSAPMILAAALMLSACVQLPDILEANTVRAASFTGSHSDMAECIRQNVVGGKVEIGQNGKRIDVFDSVKSWGYIGVTHYAFSVYENGGIELRKLPADPLTEEANKRLWVPVEGCINRAAGA